jgi:hypothetical protein
LLLCLLFYYVCSALIKSSVSLFGGNAAAPAPAAPTLATAAVTETSSSPLLYFPHRFSLCVSGMISVFAY